MPKTYLCLVRISPTTDFVCKALGEMTPKYSLAFRDGPWLEHAHQDLSFEIPDEALRESQG